MLEQYPRYRHCSVVFDYVLQSTIDNENEVIDNRLLNKGDYAKLSASIMAVDCFSNLVVDEQIEIFYILWKFYRY